ncbi:MAG: 3'-5' exonuclease [Duncaniella sp.]|nr:3'-5' exonuclease [Duncaniella sp.]
MKDFVAIDVETANYERTSICSIGAVKVRDGQVVDTFYELVKPEPEYYVRRFTETIHGISMRDTENARTFDAVWRDLHPWLEGLPLVAHNKAFDEGCIRACHRVYRMDYPEYPFYCTYLMARRAIRKPAIGSYSLPVVCSYLGIEFSDHHQALPDAMGCAQICLALTN